MFDILNNCKLFQGLNPEEIGNVFKGVLFQKKKYSKGQVIAIMDETCNHLLIVLTGSVKGEMIDFSGKVIKIEDIKAPSPIASAFIFGMNNRFPVNITANEDTEIVFIEKGELLKLLKQNTLLLRNFLNLISTRAQFLSNKIKFLSFKTIKGKVAHYILDLAGKENTTIVLSKTQTELADFFGVTRPSLARAMGEMEKDNIISISRREIGILSRDKLKGLLN